MAGGGNRAEADRWLVTSEKLLASSDLHGAKSFAIRACESDPTRAQAADYILAICDILIAGEIRVTVSNLPDWYSVLRLGRLTQSPEHVATQYRRLALLLNPSVNRLPFADKAFELVSDAWRVLSDPIRKSSYDRALQPSQLGQLGGASQLGASFWTACPYCFVLFEYPRDYEECVMKCRDCKRAFQAVRIQKPPAVVEGEEDVYFCSWSVFPLGFSGEFNQAPATRTRWSPISPLIACPKKRKEPASPRVFYDDEDDDDDVYVAISDDDDEVAVDTGKGKGKEPVVVSRPVSHHHNGSRKRSGAGGGKSVGRLDLNVELSNDVEEGGGVSGRRESNREVDNIIEGIGFFEGLDEFLSSLPILSVVGDDKIKAT
ncbi:BnaA02g34190D [Brassica napus]|uniref:(rape) hypothetical protein n=1 Tax=Brassica napus TaxID=3708 RepID=A0A078H1D5_BRANA|nr:unnamed protein product [Brassica napus]CDY31322.1 BnaA02g34190D [Brassica napus]